MVSLLLLAACASSESPESILQKTYGKMESLESFSIVGTMDISLGDDENSISIPMDLNMNLVRNDLDNLSDDESYVAVNMDFLGQTTNSKTWIKDGVSYIDDGTNKYYRNIDANTLNTQIDSQAFAKQLIESCNSIDVSKDGNKTILTFDVKDGAFKDIASSLNTNIDAESLSLVEESLDDLVVEAFTLTINGDGYTENVYLKGHTNADTLEMTLSMSLDIKDYNSASIPSFNKDEFVSEDSIHDSMGNNEDEDVTLDEGPTTVEEVYFDDGTHIIIDGAGDTNYYPFFHEDEQTLYIMSEDDILSYGFIMEQDTVDEIIGEIKKIDSITDLKESKGSNYNLLTGFASGDSDYFKANTPFAAYSFDNIDLGMVIVGLSDQATFDDIVKTLKFTTYKE